MNLNISIIKSVLTIYDEMLSNGSSLIYLGEFNQDITKMFTSMAEDEMERHQEEARTIRRVYHVMVEILQNMQKHSDEVTGERIAGNGLFIIGKREEKYYVITSNKVRHEKVDALGESIDWINSSSKEELTQAYRKQIKEGMINDKGGAGLGLIDIARKNGQKYEYMFFELDEEYSLFVMQTEIDTLYNKKKSTHLE
jgi:hypothetical protein